MSSWYWHQYTRYYASCIHLLHWTLSFHVLISSLHVYCYTGYLLFHVHVSLTYWPLFQHVPGHYYFMWCITVTRSQFLHVLVLALHEYSRTRETVITCAYLWYWILLLHVLVDLLYYASIWLFYSYLLSHWFTCMHAMLVFVFPLSWRLFVLYGLLLHEYSCILVTWLVSVTDIDILVTGHLTLRAFKTWQTKNQ